MNRENLGSVLAEPGMSLAGGSRSEYSDALLSGWDGPGGWPEKRRTPKTPGLRGGECLVSRQELEMLLRESETEKEKGYRNLFAGIAACGVFGTLSTVAAHFGELLETGMHPLESAFLILMVSATMASTALAIFFHGRVRKFESGLSRRGLASELVGQVESPTNPDDPREWP